MDIKELKNSIRKEKIKERKALTDDEIRAFSLEICKKIIYSDVYAHSGTILVYNAVRGEADLEELIKDAMSQGKKMAYPICTGSGIMEAYIPDNESAFIKGAYNIQEPDIKRSKKISPDEIDLVIAPCSAFDESGRRLGMGGGYYDRYLAKCINAAKTAAAYEFQKVDEVPTDSFDILMDIVFTQEKEYRVK